MLITELGCSIHQDSSEREWPGELGPAPFCWREPRDMLNHFYSMIARAGIVQQYGRTRKRGHADEQSVGRLTTGNCHVSSCKLVGGQYVFDMPSNPQLAFCRKQCRVRRLTHE